MSLEGINCSVGGRRSSLMESVGQVTAQAPHPMHLSLETDKFPFAATIAWTGQRSVAHNWQLLHVL
jgi:hypothetical protein